GDDGDDSIADDRVASGRLSTTTDTDYYRFRAVDNDWFNDGDDNFHVDIRFSLNPADEFRVSVWRTTSGGCPGTLLCSASPGSASDYFSWYTDFHAFESGEAPCTNGTYVDAYGVTKQLTDSTNEWCSDNTAYFYVQVTRRAGATPSCSTYTLNLTNE
ncbi:MAG: hypothetical protein FJ098_12455, partial [Deltaproteobacteria bacterium]|nr:hypothetical protein [Deltaproteobacteria bacterium]